MSPSPLRVRSLSGWSGPVVFMRRAPSRQARVPIRSRNRSVYPPFQVRVIRIAIAHLGD